MEKNKKPPAKATKLTDLIQYQEASVVSRTLIDKKAGTVALFAFGAKQGLNEHTASCDTLVQIIEGEAEVNIEATAHRLKTRETTIIPSNTSHGLKTNEKFKILLTLIRST